MPPKKTFTFENLLNSNIKVVIEAYTPQQASDLLNSAVKEPNDYKHYIVS